MRSLIIAYTLLACPSFAQDKMDPAMATAINDAGCVVSEQQLLSIVAKVGLERTFDQKAFYDLNSSGELLSVFMVHKGYARPDGYFEVISKHTGEGQLGLLVVPPSICTRSAITSSPAYNAFLIDGLIENAKLYRPSDESSDPMKFPLLRSVLESLGENGCEIAVAWDSNAAPREKDSVILAGIAEKVGVDLNAHPDIGRLLQLSLLSDEVWQLSDHRRPLTKVENLHPNGQHSLVTTLLDCSSW